MTGGATGILYPRWRPLLDGPLFGAFGGFGMDGSITPRADMAGKVARWANANADLWKSRPVRGEVGIVFVPESQIFAYVQQGATRHYTESARGAYQAFFDSNIQADFVRIDHIGEYPLVYLPYPVHLKPATAKQLKAYVENGGILVSEGLPGYFGERGKVGTVQPNYGFDTLFGAKESYVEFTPDLLNDLTLEVKGKQVSGRFFLQAYEPAGAQPAGRYKDGRIAAVERQVGKGRVLLIGTFPGAGYFLHHGAGTREFFVPWAGLRQTASVDNTQVKARVHSGPGGTYVWVVNPTRQPQTVNVSLDRKVGSFTRARDLWQEKSDPKADGGKISLTVEDRNVAVLKLD
jgi:beta-galactosidase